MSFYDYIWIMLALMPMGLLAIAVIWGSLVHYQEIKDRDSHIRDLDD